MKSLLAPTLLALAVLAAACGSVDVSTDAGGPDAESVDARAADAREDAAPDMHALTVTLGGDGDGSVTSAPAGIDCGSVCTHEFAEDTVVTLTATPEGTSSFGGWAGACTGTGSCVVTVEDATSVTATFDPPGVYTLTVTAPGSGFGTVTSDPAGINCGSDCTEEFTDGTEITLTANANLGTTFTGWSGGGCSGTDACIITISDHTSIAATFELDEHVLTVETSGTGAGSVSSSPPGISCGSDCTETYTYNTTVTLTANATLGSTFTGWTGGGCSGAGTCIVHMTEAVLVTAGFSADDYVLTVEKAGTGEGTVTSTPPGIDCGSDCAEPYVYNTTVTLSASASPGSTFFGWSGAGCTGVGDCSVNMATSAAVTATFLLDNFELTVDRDGTGIGTVTSDISGIDCGTDCSEIYPYDTVVTLSALATIGSTFTGWSGSDCSGTGDCVVTMTEVSSVTATFTLNQYLLTVVKGGDGEGTVTSDPPGIDCGTDCDELYDYDTEVTLTAITGVDSAFTGWAGGGCGGTGDCVVNMTVARTVTATFSSYCGPEELTIYGEESVVLDYLYATQNWQTEDWLLAYNSPSYDTTGWVGFDVSELPSGYTITGMTLHAYLWQTSGAPQTEIWYSTANDWTRGAATTDSIPRTQSVSGSTTSFSVNAWNSFAIDPGARSWNADISDDWLTLGIDNHADPSASPYVLFWGVDQASYRPYLVITGSSCL